MYEIIRMKETGEFGAHDRRTIGKEHSFKKAYLRTRRLNKQAENGVLYELWDSDGIIPGYEQIARAQSLGLI